MPLLRLDSASLHYGTHVLLDEVDLSITTGDKLGLLGRNGAGKTTLLKVLAGELGLDSGERWLRPGVRLARLEQTLPEGAELTVYDVVASGLAEAPNTTTCCTTKRERTWMRWPGYSSSWRM